MTRFMKNGSIFFLLGGVVFLASSAHAFKSGGRSSLFIVNEPEKAFAQAKKENRPLLIDFFGEWCPPCNELDEEVFSTPEFKKKSAGFIRLKLDADREISWKLKAQFKVGGYPTILFTSADGEEVSRIVGFREKEVFLHLMSEAWEWRGQSVASARVAAQKGDRAARDRLGIMHLERNEYSDALQWLDGTEKYREQVDLARIALAEESPQGASLMIEYLGKYPRTPDSIGIRAKLASHFRGQGKADLQSQQLRLLIESAQGLASQVELLRKFDLTPADLWVEVAKAHAAMNEALPAKTAWLQAVREYQKKIRTGRERGYHLEMAYCLWKAGDYSGAEAIYEKFQKMFPSEFTFYYSHANMMMEQKKFLEAEKLSGRALEFSYGDNRLRAAAQHAQAQWSAGHRSSALETLHSILKTTRAPDDPGLRTHHYIKKLRDLEKEYTKS